MHGEDFLGHRLQPATAVRAAREPFIVEEGLVGEVSDGVCSSAEFKCEELERGTGIVGTEGEASMPAISKEHFADLVDVDRIPGSHEIHGLS